LSAVLSMCISQPRAVTLENLVLQLRISTKLCIVEIMKARRQLKSLSSALKDV
jgi:hypothetical protein